MPRTALEIQEDIDTINAALQSMYAGTRLTELRVGSGNFIRLYKYQEISVDKLLELKGLLEAELQSVTPTTTPIFRTFGSIPMIVTKQGI